MKAVGIRRPGQQSQLSLMDISIPAIDENEVLVRVHAAGVGSHDRWALPANPYFPFAIGLEGAGVIVNMGGEVSDFAVGDRVMFSIMGQPKGGTWAEFAAVPAEALIAMPVDLTFSKAAALPIAGKTALEGIKALNLSRGGTVLIAGASGAIGTLAIQLASMRGYRIAASASARNHDFMRELGAELTVDYRDSDWPQQVLRWISGGIDATLAIQPGTGTASVPAVKDGGKVVTISGDQVIAERAITVEQISHHPETQLELAQLAADVAAGRVQVVVGSTYPLAEGAVALAKTETRHARGKVILTIQEE